MPRWNRGESATRPVEMDQRKLGSYAALVGLLRLRSQEGFELVNTIQQEVLQFLVRMAAECYGRPSGRLLQHLPFDKLHSMTVDFQLGKLAKVSKELPDHCGIFVGPLCTVFKDVVVEEARQLPKSCLTEFFIILFVQTCARRKLLACALMEGNGVGALCQLLESPGVARM